jgi:hypothetical protein
MSRWKLFDALLCVVIKLFFVELVNALSFLLYIGWSASFDWWKLPWWRDFAVTVSLFDWYIVICSCGSRFNRARVLKYLFLWLRISPFMLRFLGKFSLLFWRIWRAHFFNFVCEFCHRMIFVTSRLASIITMFRWGQFLKLFQRASKVCGENSFIFDHMFFTFESWVIDKSLLNHW